jgi:ceramide glucosyltransferase
VLQVVAWSLLAAAFAALVFFMSGVWATLRHRSRPAPVWTGAWPGISLLKPIKGDEEELRANLRTFFVQDYPGELEIVFSTADADDAGLAAARELAREYPSIDVRFVLSDVNYGLNPKLSNLAAALDTSKYDLVLQSDANVRVRPDYLTRIVGQLLAEDASLLSSMVVGAGEESAGAAMENLQLSAWIAPATCFALHFAGVTCVIGKSMLLRKSELADVGGLVAFKDHLTEDYLIGRAYEVAGKRVILSTTTVENVNVRISVDRFLARHARWLKMRAVIHVPAFCGDLLGNPVSVGLVGVALGGFQPAMLATYAAIVLAKLALDVFVMRRTRGHGMHFRHLALAPIKDLLMAAVWPYSAVSRSVEWRGVRLKVGRMSKLSPVATKRERAEAAEAVTARRS